MISPLPSFPVFFTKPTGDEILVERTAQIFKILLKLRSLRNKATKRKHWEQGELVNPQVITV
jgi:hypothetical protein